MRFALAKLLLQKPNLLLLDEPTNHLDLEARNWLEEYLHNYPHAYMLISHDRYFLDVTVNKIAEIWNKRSGSTRENTINSYRRRRSATSNYKPPTAISAIASSNWKYSSTASATRLRKRSRCRAASRSWKKSNASKSRAVGGGRRRGGHRRVHVRVRARLAGAARRGLQGRAEQRPAADGPR